MFTVASTIMNVTATGIKFNGQNYDDWVDCIKLHADVLGLDTILVTETKPAEPTPTTIEAERKLWQTWKKFNRLLLSFLKLSIV